MIKLVAPAALVLALTTTSTAQTNDAPACPQDFTSILRAPPCVGLLNGAVGSVRRTPTSSSDTHCIKALRAYAVDATARTGFSSTCVVRHNVDAGARDDRHDPSLRRRLGSVVIAADGDFECRFSVPPSFDPTTALDRTVVVHCTQLHPSAEPPTQLVVSLFDLIIWVLAILGCAGGVVIVACLGSVVVEQCCCSSRRTDGYTQLPQPASPLWPAIQDASDAPQSHAQELSVAVVDAPASGSIL